MKKTFWFNADQYLKNFSDPEYYLWRKTRAPDLFESIKTLLPQRHQAKQNIGLLYAFSEQGMDRQWLSVFTLDEKSYDSLHVLKPETEVTLFDSAGKQIYVGPFDSIDRSFLLSASARQAFVGL